MSVLGKLFAAGIRTATLPISVAADVLTLGGAVNDHGQTYTYEKIKKIADDLSEAADEAAE